MPAVPPAPGPVPLRSPATETAGMRRRLTGTVFVSVASGMIAVQAAFTAGPLAALDITGSPAWSGAPASAVILGTAAGSMAVSMVMARRGRRLGLVIGWVAGLGGAILAAGATGIGSFPLLVTAMLLIGCGQSANQLGRYAAADAHPPTRRASVISLIVWAGTIGAVIGPSLLSPLAPVVVRLGLGGTAGGFLAAVAGFGVAALVCHMLLRPEPSLLRAADAQSGKRISAPRPDAAIIALLTAQFVMVLIMTMTPVHLHGHGLGVVGLVMSLHLAGMFALAPVAGWLADRVGAMRVVFGGLFLVATAGIAAATAQPGSHGLLGAALLLLGLGWSAAFVGGSALLAHADARLQGRVDALKAVTGGLAGLLSGVVVATFGYPVLALAGTAVALAVAIFVALGMAGVTGTDRSRSEPNPLT